jgi:hypothetical protein
MSHSKTRRKFLQSNLMMMGGLILPSTYFQPLTLSTMQDKRPDPIRPELIKEFVGNAHGDLDKVKSLIESEPALLNSAWDWGGGDFETALNAAGHMGRRDIAEFLLARGARMDIFCAAMMGNLEIVQRTLEAFPNLKTSKGPHGLALLHHANAGGPQAKAVLEYLQSIGAS